ncbi:MAG TPA: D-glycerate dehydrogenase [Fimbriimonas sp.]
MKPKVLVRHSLPQAALDELRANFEETEDPEQAEGVVGFLSTSLDLGRMPRLRAVATVSAGYDNYDLPELTRRRIALMNCADALTETTADLAFALMLASARRVAELDALVRSGGWKPGAGSELYGLDVHGKTLGVVGYGRIGSAIARRGKGFGMEVLYTSRRPKETPGRVVLDELLRRSDFVCLAVPLTPDTDRLIGSRELGLMKPTGILVNIARGRVVDESALVEALRRQTIRAAGLDVYEEEPLSPTSPLIGMPNVVLLPHIGSATQETRDAMALASVRNLISCLVHGEPRNVVNSEALE